MNIEYSYWFWLILKFIIGFAIIIAYFFFTGKNQLSKMTTIDLVGNFILGGIVGGVIYNTDIPILQYITVLIIGLTIISAISYYSTKYSKAREVTVGKSLILIKKGKIQFETLCKNQMKIDVVDMLSRLQLKGYKSFADIKYLQLEPNGDIIVFEDDTYPSLIIFRQGEWITDAIERVDISVEVFENAIRGLDKEKIVFIEFQEDILTIVLQDKCEQIKI